MLRWQHLPNTLSSQIIRFMIVGGITFSLDMTVLVILTDYFEVHYLISAATGFISGSTLNYVFSIFFVFHSGRFNRRKNEFIIFIILTLIGVLFNHGIMYLGHGIFMISYKMVKVVSLFAVTIFNFLTKKYVVFLK